MFSLAQLQDFYLFIAKYNKWVGKWEGWVIKHFYFFTGQNWNLAFKKVSKWLQTFDIYVEN